MPRFPADAKVTPSSSYVKSRTRGEDTRPERFLRCAVWHRGLRYRIHGAIAGRPDLYFSREKVAIFCDGDFWHGRDWKTRRRKVAAGANSTYWIAKIEGNIRRDRVVTRRLTAEGWVVLRFWETDIMGDVELAAGKVESVVRSRRESTA